MENGRKLPAEITHGKKIKQTYAQQWANASWKKKKKQKEKNNVVNNRNIIRDLKFSSGDFRNCNYDAINYFLCNVGWNVLFINRDITTIIQ